MHGSDSQIGVGCTIFRQIIAVVIAGIMMLQPLFASDSWSRIKKLKKGTRIYVRLTDEQYTTGSFLRADDSSLIIRVINNDEVTLEMNHVQQVAVNHSGRRWYSIPLAIVAGIVGGFGGNEIVKRTTCFDTRENCSKAKGFIIGITSAVPAAATYKLTEGKPGIKVIYTKGR
ncbi:MAG: hypothetical protein P8Z37_17985 [Acidobacteriota bacterium]|jgi:hypothetical protein